MNGRRQVNMVNPMAPCHGPATWSGEQKPAPQAGWVTQSGGSSPLAPSH